MKAPPEILDRKELAALGVRPWLYDVLRLAGLERGAGMRLSDIEAYLRSQAPPAASPAQGEHFAFEALQEVPDEDERAET